MPWFKDRASWSAWFSFVAALFVLPMTAEQVETFKQCTGRTAPPTTPASEAWLVCGRRAGKSFMLALVAVFLACFRDYRQHLAPGERGTIMIIAADRKQSRVILRYVRALLTRVPMLARMIERETAESFDLTNAVSIEVATASYRSTRGYTLVAALLDELAFWPTDEAAEPDYEVLHALRPGMATIPGAVLLCASSPYAQRGALWASLDAAIRAAIQKVEAAQSARAVEMQKLDAIKLRSASGAFAAHMKKLDKALDELVNTLYDAEPIRQQLHALGVGPSLEQFRVLGERPILLALADTDFEGRIGRRLAPNERMTFAQLAEAWSRQHEVTIARILGEDQKTSEAAGCRAYFTN